MLQMNIALDVCGIIICLILLLYIWMHYSKASKSNRLFAIICLLNILMALGDIASWSFMGLARPWYPVANTISVVIYYVCIPPLLLSFAVYMFVSYPIPANIRKPLLRGAAALCCVHLVCSVISLWNGMFFTIGADNIYRRGDWFWLSQLIPALIFLINVALIFICRKHIGKRDVFFLSSYIFFIAIAQTVQIFNYGVALNNVGVALSLLIVFINIQSQRELRMEKQERELAESRLSIMLSQIQPHFLYNTLVAIRTLCRIDPKTAEETVLEFSEYLRGNMDSILLKEPILFEKELHHVEIYLKIEKKRFNDKLNVSYDIKTKDFMIPALTLQPIVENAVKHGITKKENGGTIEIKTEETENAFLITVADNGMGFDVNKIPENDGRSHIGIENSRSRLAAMCGGTLEIQSKPGEGTTAVITLPKTGNK